MAKNQSNRTRLQPVKKVGRPSDYTEEITLKICTRLMRGESLRNICRDTDMPHRDTIHVWLLKHKEFADQYARARRIQAEELFDEILEIADEKQGDTYCDEYGNAKQNHEYINRSRLRIDTRKWYLSKVLPKVYGDKPEEGDLEKKEFPGITIRFEGDHVGKSI